MLRGGGKAHGPKPRDFSTGLQKKVYDLAWRTALSYRFRRGELIIVDNALELESPSASLLQGVFNNNKWGQKYGRSLLVTLQDRPLLAKALDESPKEGWTGKWNEVDVKDMLTLGRVVIERPALKNILLSHQNDLVNSKFPPKLSKSLEPIELQAALGWPEFRRLEALSSEQPESLKASLLERVANKRLEQATALPPAEAIEQQVSAYTLLSEVRRVQAELLESHPDLEFDADNDEDGALQINAHMKRTEIYKLMEQSCDYLAKKSALLNEDNEVAKWEGEARYWQEEAETLQQSIDELLGVEETA
jgi:large subunit ribosomal protein L4